MCREQKGRLMRHRGEIGSDGRVNPGLETFCKQSQLHYLDGGIVDGEVG